MVLYLGSSAMVSAGEIEAVDPNEKSKPFGWTCNNAPQRIDGPMPGKHLIDARADTPRFREPGRLWLCGARCAPCCVIVASW
jgi:hypothetical protein